MHADVAMAQRITGDTQLWNQAFGGEQAFRERFD